MVEPRSKNDVVTRELLDERTCRLMAIINAAKELEGERHDAIEAKLVATNESLEYRLAHLNELKQWRDRMDGILAERATVRSVVGAYVLAVAGWIIGPLLALAIERMIR